MTVVDRATDLESLNVAVVHDWLTGMRGGEKVLEAILEIFPQAEIHTLFHFPEAVSDQINEHPIHRSFLQSTANRIGNYRRLLPLFPFAVSRWDLSRFDLVVSSSHCVAKGVETGDVPHVCYCHTPMRYMWDRFDDYFPPSRPLARLVAGTIAPAMRRWDRETASGVDRFVANSSFVADRVSSFFGRDAEVIHPFVDQSFLSSPLESDRDSHHVIVSALVPYKRVEDAMRVARELDRPLEVIGDGPERERLEALAGGSVRLRGRLSFEEMVPLIARARSLIIPGVEDFGITALEAMALGTPVIATEAGGTRDSVLNGRTGVLFDHEREGSLAEAIVEVERIEWNREELRAHASGFSREQFKRRFVATVREVLE